MNQLAPLLKSFLEQQARPHVQTKVAEHINSTKGDLKNDLPNTIINYLSGKDGNGGGNSVVSEILSKLGPNFMTKLNSVTNVTVDTASEGMDTLLTNGVMNIAKGVLTKQADDAPANGQEVSRLDFDFLKSGKDGMVQTTMAASMPVIKQVSDNMGNKLSSSFPAAIGGAIQQLIDENGGADGVMGMAAGLMSKFVGGGHAPGDQVVNEGGSEKDVQATGGHLGGIQQLLQNLLAPKILLLIQPYLQKFEAQMTTSLENELRTKVFSAEYIKQTVMATLTGVNGQGGSGAGAMLNSALNSFMQNKGQQNGQQSGAEPNASQALKAVGNLASTFFQNKG
ncbi:hypothetical protein EDD11_005234 [Mortierella claussenii]|nr:hypothetical protein EDD11_005234 [Mortierella claussenii]